MFHDDAQMFIMTTKDLYVTMKKLINIFNETNFVLPNTNWSATMKQMDDMHGENFICKTWLLINE